MKLYYVDKVESLTNLKQQLDRLKNAEKTSGEQSIGAANCAKEYNTCVEFNSMLVRPMQDITKILHYFKDISKFECDTIDENNENIHAELNLAFNFPLLDKHTYYIGVSKLCCVPCDHMLNKFGYLHRGTHSIYFKNDDKLPTMKQKQYFMEELKNIYSNKNNKYIQNTPSDICNTWNQHRRLSNDYAVERQIVELFELKKNLGLYEKHQSKTNVGRYISYLYYLVYKVI